MSNKKNITKQTLNKQLVVVTMGEELYGVNVMQVESIERMVAVARVPDSPESVMGVINLRGDIVPVLSLRSKLGLESKQHDADTRIVVVHAQDYRVGVFVDKVVEILTISEDSIQSIGEVMADRDRQFFGGVVEIRDELIMLLNVEKVLSIENSNNRQGA